MSPVRRSLDFTYMFVSQRQPLQIADNKLLMVFFSQGNYNFASKITPVFRGIHHNHVMTRMTQYLKINLKA